jgi:hypothetical protein
VRFARWLGFGDGLDVESELFLARGLLAVNSANGSARRTGPTPQILDHKCGVPHGRIY